MDRRADTVTGAESGPPPTPALRYPELSSSTERTPLLSGSLPDLDHDHESSSLLDGSRDNNDNNNDTAQDQPQSLGPLRITCIAISLWLLIFVQASNMSGITMIQGAIAKDLNAYEGTMWFTSGYLIALSSLAPLSGRLAGIFSPRSLVVPISVSVALGTALCAAAPTFAVFVLGRVVTGVGGAGVMSLAIILVLDLADKRRRGLVMGMVNAGFSVGVSIGGVVFGALLSLTGWRLLFAIQCPLTILSGIGLYFSIPHRQPTDKDLSKSTSQKLRDLDYLGAALLVLTIVTFLYGLAGEIEPLCLVISLFALISFLAVEYLFASDPIIPLNVLSSRAVLLSCLAQLGLMTARWTALFYTPIFMLAVRGSPRAQAGSILIPTNGGFAVGGMLVGWFHVRRNGSFWLPCLVSIAVFSMAMWLLSFVADPDTSLAVLVLTVIASGFSTGSALNYTLAHILHHSHDGTQYITTSLIGTFRGFGGAFGTSIGGGIFTRLLSKSLRAGYLALDGDDDGDGLSPARRKLISQLLGAPELVYGSSLDAEERQVAIDAYTGASRGLWQAAAVLGLVVFVLQAGTGWNGPPKKDEEEEEDQDKGHASATSSLMDDREAHEA